MSADDGTRSGSPDLGDALVAALGFEPTSSLADDGSGLLVDDGSGNALAWAGSELPSTDGEDAASAPADHGIPEAGTSSGGSMVGPDGQLDGHPSANAAPTMSPPTGNGPPTSNNSGGSGPLPTDPPMPGPGSALPSDERSEGAPPQGDPGPGAAVADATVLLDPAGFGDDGGIAAVDPALIDGHSSGVKPVIASEPPRAVVDTGPLPASTVDAGPLPSGHSGAGTPAPPVASAVPEAILSPEAELHHDVPTEIPMAGAVPAMPPPPLVGDPTHDGSVDGNGFVVQGGPLILNRADLGQGRSARAGEIAARVPNLLDKRLLRRTKRVRARKVRRVVRHIDPWSVLTFSVLFHLCVFAALLLASVLVWNAAVAAGTIENIESFIRELGDYTTFEIKGDVVFRAAMVIAGILTLASSVMVVLLTVIFNLISDLVGGIRVTVVEEETVRVRRRTAGGGAT